MILATIVLLISASEGRLLVVNQGDKTMSVVDSATNKVVATLDEKQTTMHGHEVAVSPDGRFAFMPIYGDVGVGGKGLDGRELLQFDLATGAIKARMDFGHGVRPHCVVFEPTKKLLYITTELDRSVTIVDPKSLKIVGKIDTGEDQSHMLAITKNGEKGYVSNVAAGSVSVLDLARRKLIKKVNISRRTQRIALSADDRGAFAGDDSKPRMAVIDTKTDTFSQWIDLPGRPFGSAATRDGKFLLVPIPEKNVVAVVAIESMKVTKLINVPAAPQEMLVRPDGKFAYVAGSRANKVAVIDTKSLEVTATIDVGAGPDGLSWAAGSSN